MTWNDMKLFVVIVSPYMNMIIFCYIDIIEFNYEVLP